jgi:hypothetical protein
MGISLSALPSKRLEGFAHRSRCRWALRDFVPGYEASAWFGVGAPKNTPVEIIEKLNREINAGLADPKMKARLADLGGTVLPGSPSDFGKLIAEETEKWGEVIRPPISNLSKTNQTPRSHSITFRCTKPLPR